MKAHFSMQSRYPAQRTFAVQEARPRLKDANVPMGSVEHLLSGQVSHFAAWGELGGLFTYILANQADKPP